MVTAPNPTAERSAVSRFDGVDTLRGVSILLVILLHFRLRMMFAQHALDATLPKQLFNLLFTNGDNGVTIFFAVSGFLIALTSLRRFGGLGGMKPARFYRIRFARIAPLLLAELAILSVLHLVHASGFRIPQSRGTLAHALFATLTFHLNWWEAVKGYLPANWDVLWSLSVEEMFYVFFPLVCLGLLRWRRGMWAFVAVMLAFVAAGPFARTIWTASNEIWQEKSYLGGMDGIALGVLTALLVDHLQRREFQAGRRWGLIAAQVIGWACIALILVYPRWHIMKLIGRSGVDGTILALGACLVIAGSVLRGGVGRRWTAPVRWFGRHSYELYMTHEFIVVWITLLYLQVLRGPLLGWVAVVVALAAVLGWAVARWFSEPMNRRLRGASPPATVPSQT